MKTFKVLLVKRGEELFEAANFFCKLKYWDDGILDYGKEFLGLPNKYIIAIQGHKIVGTMGMEEKKVPIILKSFNPLNKKGVEVMRYSLDTKGCVNNKREIISITKLLFKKMIIYFGDKIDDYFIFLQTYRGVVSIFTRASGIAKLPCYTKIKVASMPNRSKNFLKKNEVEYYFFNTKEIVKNYFSKK
ncbi:MAG: hypothetical protein U9O66_02560 [Patescibacteria group bacterium]|nr:hypothetical protein [Patescibacteria group bacterium]